MDPISELRASHRQSLADLVRRLLVQHDWRLFPAAMSIGVHPQVLRRIVTADPELAADYARRNPGVGHPPRNRPR